jgi:hypothetical protein
MFPYRECPSFEVCSCNVCPLDPNYELRARLPGEETCRAQKRTRVRIGSKYASLLKYGGLNKREWIGRMHWDNMTDAQKDAQRAIVAAAYAKIKKTPINHILGVFADTYPQEQTGERRKLDENCTVLQSL